ncbi:hypothetical protein BT63DRAFT_453133 [Microthyrium microscopicum]|uniref:Apple domain-containing protein n=1 Tax=Microthyrium microscopicum TaxID=703497 RepID=A0A6A6UI76_9PEZI|nr:hypothetical protein BT63DRAFT_453133 [Microthyrium microscopicum]
MRHSLFICSYVAVAFAVTVQQTSCGLKGYDKGTSAYSVTTQSTAATYAACGALCQSDSKCKSFAFGSGACYLYSVLAGSNVNVVSSSPYTFYDKTCVSQASSSTRLTSSTARPASISSLGASSSKSSIPASQSTSSSAPAASISSTCAFNGHYSHWVLSAM